MIQPTIVEEIQTDHTVLVRYPNPKAEKSKASRSFWNVKERTFPVENPENLFLLKGDMVEILVDQKGSIKAAFMIFMVPLLGFLLFYGLGSLFLQSEGLLFLSGVIGLCAGMGVNVLVRKFKGPGTLPVIQKKMTPEGMKEFMKCHDACKSCKGCG
ncbi:MAG: SoxR reducing system RseC family protein [Spirochaetales bacterium]|nr:SoxR reducing system RseC family protein [Spirochaetales bacterium]